MAEQNFPDNTIYELDNLDVLRGMNSETVDLIATDPPFNTKRNRAGTAGFYTDTWRWADTNKLPDQWTWSDVHPIWLDEIRDENRALFEVIEAASHCHGQDIAAFLCFLSVRILEMHRILKPTGSLYLHCDHTANAYIRMALDAIFGAKNFQNEIVWSNQGSWIQPNNRYPRRHDTIYYYTKTKETTFVPLHEDDAEEQINFKRWRNYIQGDNIYGGNMPSHDKRFKPYLDKFTKVHGRKPKKEEIVLKINGSRIGDVQHIKVVDPKSPERTGSPDQKPLALYERIVLASSNPGDLVLDPFAGCATTIMAAQNNGRRWVGIDRRPDARFHVVCRMDGIKAKDAEGIRKLPHLTDWLDARLARHEAHFRTEPPTRTDEGDTAAPFLAAVHTASEKSLLSHREMKDYLLETFGLRCWGCTFTAPDERYLELDHVDPKADGGSNHLDNRALLCKPCNGAKSNNLTMGALRRQNTKEGHLEKPPGTKRGDDGHPIRLPEARAACREALERYRRGQPMQLSMML